MYFGGEGEVGIFSNPETPSLGYQIFWQYSLCYDLPVHYCESWKFFPQTEAAVVHAHNSARIEEAPGGMQNFGLCGKQITWPARHKRETTICALSAAATAFCPWQRGNILQLTEAPPPPHGQQDSVPLPNKNVFPRLSQHYLSCPLNILIWA